jgi:hypothetical protein
MERSEISLHELKVYLALKNNSDKWLSNEDIAGMVTGVSPRTIRQHTRRLVKLGVIDQAEVFPRHHYKISEKAGKRNQSYVARLESAAVVFGLS